jgi:hypothetical protein
VRGFVVGGGDPSGVTRRVMVAVKDEVGQALDLGPLKGVVHVRRLGGQHVDDLVDAAVVRWPGTSRIPAPDSGCPFFSKGEPFAEVDL